MMHFCIIVSGLFICFLLFLFFVCGICPVSLGYSILCYRIGSLWKWFLQGSIYRIADYHKDGIVQGQA